MNGPVLVRTHKMRDAECVAPIRLVAMCLQYLMDLARLEVHDVAAALGKLMIQPRRQRPWLETELRVGTVVLGQLAEAWQ